MSNSPKINEFAPDNTSTLLHIQRLHQDDDESIKNDENDVNDIVHHNTQQYLPKSNKKNILKLDF